jgi:hypothetical protein
MRVKVAGFALGCVPVASLQVMATEQIQEASFYNVGNHVLWAWSETKGYASRKFSA